MEMMTFSPFSNCGGDDDLLRPISLFIHPDPTRNGRG